MKYNNKLLFSGLLSLALLSGCNTDELQELNINPQEVTQINLNFLLTAAQLGAASGGSAGDNRYIDWRTNIGMCSMAIQQIANAGGGIAPGDKYTENVETYTAPWDFIYGDQLKNLSEILYQTGPNGFDAGNKVNTRNAARILRAFLFHRLTDYYGSIPYSEALTASRTDGTFFPKYDKQKDIYLDLLKELDEASSALSASNPDEGFAAADIYFDGDIAKWKKWGYSLMLRLAMRISNVDAATAGSYVQKAIAGGVMTSNADNVIVPMATGPSEWTNQNGISRAFYPGDGGQPSYLSKTLVDWLKGPSAGSTTDDDPRLMIMSGGIINWSPTDVTIVNADPLAQKGMPNGKDATTLAEFEGLPAGQTVDQPNTYYRINPKMLDDGDPYMLMSYGEVELLLAEAAERSIGGASGAEGHYKAGVKASCQMYTIYDETLTASDAAVDAYLAARPYGGNKLQMIGEQLWANKFLNWWDAWADWRRTGFPVLTPTNYPGNETGGVIPQRLKYPVGEVAGNPNFDAGATKPNNYVTKVWWAGGPE